MSEARENETIVLSDGRRVGLARYGAMRGMPILALHGAPASRFMFDVAHGPAFDLGVTLLCPDRPGYGLTPIDRDGTLEMRTDMNVALVDALGLERFHILGISGGGPYAVALAARLKDRIKGVALVSPIGPVADTLLDGRGYVHPFHRWFFTRLPQSGRGISWPGRISARAFKAAPVMFTRMFARSLGAVDKAVLNQPHVERSLIRMTAEAMRQGPGGGIEDLKIFSQPWNVDYSDVVCPCVLWQGSQDRIVPPVVSLNLADRLPLCEAVRLGGHGHFWVYNHARDVLARLKNLG